MGHTGERDPSSARAPRDNGVGPVQLAPSEEGWHIAEQALEQERQLRFLTDNVPTVLYQLRIEPSGKRRFVYVSVGVEAFHGLTVAQVLANASLIGEHQLDLPLTDLVMPGMNGLLAKPYSVHDLSRRVRELLDLPS